MGAASVQMKSCLCPGTGCTGSDAPERATTVCCTKQQEQWWAGRPIACLLTTHEDVSWLVMQLNSQQGQSGSPRGCLACEACYRDCQLRVTLGLVEVGGCCVQVPAAAGAQQQASPVCGHHTIGHVDGCRQRMDTAVLTSSKCRGVQPTT